MDCVTAPIAPTPATSQHDTARYVSLVRAPDPASLHEARWSIRHENVEMRLNRGRVLARSGATTSYVLEPFSGAAGPAQRQERNRRTRRRTPPA